MIDWTRVQALHDEVGAEDFDEIVEIFMEEVEEIVAGLAKISDRSTLGDDLHSLKGSALNLGFSEFCKLCEAGEAAAEDGKADTIDVEAVIDSYAMSKQVFLSDKSQLNAA